MTAPRQGRGKAQKNLDLIEAAFHILDEIQPASVRAVCYPRAGLLLLISGNARRSFRNRLERKELVR